MGIAMMLDRPHWHIQIKSFPFLVNNFHETVMKINLSF